MKRVYYHGTSADNLETILKKGIQPIPCAERYWNDSYPNLVYMWDDIAADGSAQSFAMESAATPIPFAKDKRAVVFKIVMPDKNVFEDGSGAGMSDLGAVSTWGIPPRFIIEYYISEDLSPLVPFLARDYFGNTVCKDWRKTDLMQWAISNLSEGSYLNISESVHWDTVQLRPMPKIREVKHENI